MRITNVGKAREKITVEVREERGRKRQIVIVLRTGLIFNIKSGCHGKDGRPSSPWAGSIGQGRNEDLAKKENNNRTFS